MALETGTYVNALVASNPASTDGLAQADDHIRLIKSTIKATVPNVTGAITASHSELNVLDGATVTTAELNKLDGVTASTTELNRIDGVTSNVQTQLNTKAPKASPTFTGTVTATTVDATSVTVTTANIGTVDLGDWRITETSGVLKFAHNGTNRMKLDASGNLTVEGNVTAYGSA